MLGLKIALRAIFHIEPFDSPIFLSPSEEWELCDCGVKSSHLYTEEFEFCNQKNLNVHRMFTILCVEQYIISFLMNEKIRSLFRS